MWSELFVLWSILSYGITADPLPEDTDGVTFKWQTWRWALLLRIVVAAVLSYWICHSVIVSAWLATLIAIQPWFRFRSPKKWTAEVEIVVVVLNLLFGFAFIRHFDLHMHAHLSLPISREQISAFEVEHTSSADASAKPKLFRNLYCAARKQIAIPERRDLI